MWGRSSSLTAAAALALLVGMAAAASAQHVAPEPPRVGPPVVGVPPTGGAGIGGGAGLIPTMPEMRSAPAIAPPPDIAPAAPVEPAAPVAPAPVVRFRCELAPQDEACREPGAPDGGGDDAECSCARDYCHDRTDPATGASTRVCEKLQ